ncbi:unnamed protein product, partial [Prorocentrum cordatum]
ALIGLLKGQLDRRGPEHLHGQPAQVPACPPSGRTGLELGLALALGLVLGLCAREALASLRAWALVLVFYEREDSFLLELVLLGHVTPTRRAVVTPHFDIFEGDLTEAMHMCLVGPMGGLPTKLSGHLLRADMDKYQRNEAALLDEGRALADEVRREGGLPAEGAGLPPLSAPDGDAEPAKALGVRADAGDVVRWMVLEPRAGYHRGDELLAGTVPRSTAGDRGIVELADGTMLAVAKWGTFEGASTRRNETAAEEQDLRTLPVRYDRAGTRIRDFANAVELMSTSPMPDWPALGTRTTAWLAQQFKRLVQTPLPRRMWWGQTRNLTAADAGVDDHQCLSELLEMGATKEQLNERELGASTLTGSVNMRLVQSVTRADRPGLVNVEYFLGKNVAAEGPRCLLSYRLGFRFAFNRRLLYSKNFAKVVKERFLL